MNIPFHKAHGAKNDFLLTDTREVPDGLDLPKVARAICDRNTGVGADGWILIDERPGIRLFNSDGSEPELSGNGTRCAAALLIQRGARENPIVIQTGAGPKELRLISRDGNRFEFEMNMGKPRVIDVHFTISVAGRDFDATLIDVGNPQCAIAVDDFAWDWISAGAAIETDAHFPNRTNVSFLRVTDSNTIDVRFYERGAGVTQSSGTGSTGAACCALTRGLVSSPVKVLTPAGPLVVEERGDYYLQGPAQIVASGIYNYDEWR
jgi:diaminopimelate epimerase